MTLSTKTTSYPHLVSRRVAGWSTAATYAVPVNQVGLDIVRLVSGAPAVEALPLAEIKAATDRIFSSPSTGGAALAYGNSSGEPRLREIIAANDGVDVDRILVTNGALHGTALAITALLDPGDVVAVDDPVFPDTVRIVESAGGVIEPIPVGRNGIDVDILAERLVNGLRIKAIYTVPDYQNPSGAVLPYADRLRLIELADRYDFVILSDNPYKEYAFDGVREPDFPADSERVVVINTFTKTLGPGFRLGWLNLPTWLAADVVNVRRRSDFHSATLSQAIVTSLLSDSEWFPDLLRRGRAIYQRRAALTVAALQEVAPGALDFVVPSGGFFVWASVAGGPAAAARLSRLALDEGVVVSAGANYAAAQDGSFSDRIRLAYSAVGSADLGAGLERFGRALSKLK